MTWTYDSTSLTTTLAQVRFLVGDTNTHDQLLTDEEITLFTDRTADIFLAAADCCNAIIGKLARNVDRSNVGMSASRSQVIQHYKDLEIKYRSMAGMEAGPFIGGLSESTRGDNEDDADAVQPAFSREQFDNS